MPIFEYTCASCGREFETLVRESSPPPQCPGCHGTDLHKKLSTFAAITGSTTTAKDTSSPCASCGHPDGPGACRFN